MTKGIFGYWIWVQTGSWNDVYYFSDPLPPGSRAYVSIALAEASQLEPPEREGGGVWFLGYNSIARASIYGFSRYRPDGSEGTLIPTGDPQTSVLFEDNLCRVVFSVEGQQAAVRAQATIHLY
jgi:hypothetical protein